MQVSISDMVRSLRERADRERAQAEARAVRLHGRLPEAAALLRRRGAQRVWLFGSLAENRPRPESDVDLAVEGLPAACYFDVLAELTETVGTRVDLVCLEKAPGSLRDRVLETGVEL